MDGSLRTAPSRHQDVSFVWTGDVVGQGWGIDPAYGGLHLFESMRRRRPDFLLHSGDTVYADGPLPPSVTLPDGRIYRNLVTPEKSKVAETLGEYRGQYAYNLLDDGYRAFAAEVPQVNRGPGRSTAGSRTGRCWTCSCWTCARSRTPTTPTRTQTRSAACSVTSSASG